MIPSDVGLGHDTGPARGEILPVPPRAQAVPYDGRPDRARRWTRRATRRLAGKLRRAGVTAGTAVTCCLAGCATPAAEADMDRWAPELRALLADGHVFADSLSVERIGEVEVLTWRRTQQAYCVTEALVWAELTTGERGTAYVLLRAMRWPPEGGDFGDRRPGWAPTSSPYGPIDNVRFLSSPPGNAEISEIWPSSMFGVGDDPGFPVIDGEVRTVAWRELVGEDPVVGQYRLDPEANVNCDRPRGP